MEAIKEFEIELDISDRTCLYDYGHEEYIFKPNKGDWDLENLKSRATTDNFNLQDENMLVRVKNMDAAISDMRFFEKAGDKGEEDREMNHWGRFDELQPSQVLPRRVLPVYRPGEVIRGKVILELIDKIDAESFIISFKGEAKCSIRVYHARGAYDDYGTEKYVHEKNAVWERAAGDGDLSDTFSLLKMDSVARSKYLPAGRHVFDFDYLIPADARQSTLQLLESYCDYALISYRIKASLEKGKFAGKENLAVCRGIWVNIPFDVATASDMLSPITAQETVSTGIIRTTGRVVVMVTLPRKVYARNEVISVTMDVNNACDVEMTSVTSRVVLSGRVRSSRAKLRASRSTCLKAAKHTIGPISANSQQQYRFTLPLNFSETIIDSNLIPVGSLDDCDLIDLDYEVVVKAKRKGLHRDIEMKIPIIIGTDNSRAGD